MDMELESKHGIYPTSDTISRFALSSDLGGHQKMELGSKHEVSSPKGCRNPLSYSNGPNDTEPCRSSRYVNGGYEVEPLGSHISPSLLWSFCIESAGNSHLSLRRGHTSRNLQTVSRLGILDTGNKSRTVPPHTHRTFWCSCPITYMGYETTPIVSYILQWITTLRSQLPPHRKRWGFRCEVVL